MMMFRKTDMIIIQE